MKLLTSRREQNKAATRNSIAQAALELLRAKGLGNFTVEELAERAGVSRRTFFNYFPSTEAAICATTEDFLDLVLESFRQRPESEPLLESAVQALNALADPMHLKPTAEIYALTIGNDAMSRFQLEVWFNCEQRLIQAAKERVHAGADELYVQTLVAAVFASGKTSMEVWFSSQGSKITAASLNELKKTLIRAVSYVRDGFALPAS